jgi:endonuclease/exonuclease/phosphatase family metal-dependent hydrolase
MNTESKNDKGSLCIFSYNSRGFTDEKQDIIKLLFVDTDEYYPIVCNQENFLLKGNRYKIKQCLPNSKIIFKPAIKEAFEGRPKHGMFIAIPQELKESAVDVSPHHERIQAVMLSLPTKVLIINSYFPTDPKVTDFDTTELMSTLEAIQRVLTDNDFHSVIWCGDINADFLRNTTFTKIVDDYVRDSQFVKAWSKFSVDYTHIYERDERTYTSTIDHVFWNEGSTEHVKEANVIHLPGNLSDHSPVYCKLETGKMKLGKEVKHIKKNPIPNWKRASDEQKGQYTDSLERKLNEINSPGREGCCDVHCKSERHRRDCDGYLEEIVNCVKTAANQCLPMDKSKSMKSKSSITEWKSEVQPLKETAMFWHAIWTSAGRPNNTALHQVMKRTRNLYHYQIRKCRKMTECIKKNTLLDACINDRGDIFKEIRKLRKSPPEMTSMIDGVTNNVEAHFAKVYEKIYNSVEDDKLAAVLGRLDKGITSESLHDVEMIQPEIIRLAICQLKNDKTDPVFQFTSDWLKAAPGNFCEHLASLFKMFLVHGHISEITLISTMIPLIKDKLGDVSSSSNYRSIALSSLILKIFD